MSNDLNKLAAGAIILPSLLGSGGAKVQTPADLQAEQPSSYSQTIPACDDPLTVGEKETEPTDPREKINKEGDPGDSLEADLRRNNEASSNTDTANSANQEQLGATPDPPNLPDPSDSEISAYPDVSPESKVNTVQDLGNYGKENLVGDYGQNDTQPSPVSETPTISDTQGDFAGDYGQNGSPSESSSAGSESSGASDSGGSSSSSETST